MTCGSPAPATADCWSAARSGRGRSSSTPCTAPPPSRTSSASPGATRSCGGWTCPSSPDLAIRASRVHNKHITSVPFSLKCVDLSHARVYDQRRSGSGDASPSYRSIAQPVRRLVPKHLREAKRQRFSVTAAVFSTAGEVLASYNDEVQEGITPLLDSKHVCARFPLCKWLLRYSACVFISGLSSVLQDAHHNISSQNIYLFAAEAGTSRTRVSKPSSKRARTPDSSDYDGDRDDAHTLKPRDAGRMARHAHPDTAHGQGAAPSGSRRARQRQSLAVAELGPSRSWVEEGSTDRKFGEGFASPSDGSDRDTYADDHEVQVKQLDLASCCHSETISKALTLFWFVC